VTTPPVSPADTRAGVVADRAIALTEGDFWYAVAGADPSGATVPGSGMHSPTAALTPAQNS
jgi:hypothetical protein